MSRSGGLISKIFRRLIPSGQGNAKLVGEDHLGNRYYEKDPDPQKNRRGARWVEARGQDVDDIDFTPEVPTEWDSWLRRRRNTPPNQEELDRNYAMMLRTQQRAKELEQKEDTTNSEKTEAGASYTETVTEDSFKSKFPQYKDLEIRPGQFKDRDKK